MKRVTVILIKVKSCKSLLLVLLVCIRSYIISVLRYKYLTLDTHHPNILYLREVRCEDPWLFFEARRGPQANTFGERWIKRRPSRTEHGLPIRQD